MSAARHLWSLPLNDLVRDEHEAEDLFVKTQRTIPLDLKDWLLHFGASLETQAFSNELASSSRRPGVRLYGSCLSEPLSELEPNDNVLHSLAI
jgi:hypothetical protein